MSGHVETDYTQEDKMSASNRTSLAQLDKMTAAEVNAIPQDHLVMLVEDLAEMKAKHAARDAKLYAEIDRRYSLRAMDQRKREAKDTGTVRFTDGAFTVIADLPKKVTWGQKELAKAANVIRNDWGGKVEEYITTKMEVSETKFNAWPEPIRNLIAPARTVGCGKATYKFEPVKEAA